MRRGQRLLAPFVVILAALFYVWWELAHRDVYAYATAIYPIDDADEWRYTACSRLVAHGYRLFDQVFSAQPPLLFLSLAGSMRVTTETISGARWAEIGFGAIGLLASIWLAWQLGGRWAGAATGLLLAVSPGFLVYAHTVEAEGPMMALSALALALGVAAFRRDSLVLALLSGIALAGAILFKLFAVEAALPLAWALAGIGRTNSQRRGRSPRLPEGAEDYGPYSGTQPIPAQGSRAGAWLLDRRAILRLCTSALGLVVPLALDFGLVSPLYQWRQVIALHDRAASIPLPNLLSPGRIVWDYLTLDAGLSLLALAGLLALVLALRSYAAGICLLWLPGSIVMLLLFRPLFPHHAAILSAPLGVSAGVGLAESIQWALGRRLFLLPLALATLVYVGFVPRLVHDDRHLLIAPAAGPDPLVSWVRSHSSSAEFVASDNTRVADLAGRLVPPPLCDPSVVRVKAGYLTATDLIAATVRYRPVIVLPTAVFQGFPQYLDWLRRHYRALSAPDGATAYILP